MPELAQLRTKLGTREPLEFLVESKMQSHKLGFGSFLTVCQDQPLKIHNPPLLLWSEILVGVRRCKTDV